MMTQYTHTITKEEISLLEIEEFPGRILVIDTEKDADKAVSYLTQFEAVGFDTETRPSFKKGTRYKISLMQISTDEACFLFRLNRIGIPQSLEDFLVNDKILKGRFVRLFQQMYKIPALQLQTPAYCVHIWDYSPFPCYFL